MFLLIESQWIAYQSIELYISSQTHWQFNQNVITTKQKKTNLQLAHHQFQRFDISTSRRPDGAFLCVLWFIGRCMCPPLTAVSIRPVSATPSAVIDGIVLYDTKQMCTDSNWPLLRTCRTFLRRTVLAMPPRRPRSIVSAPHPPRFPERPATSPLNVNVFHFFFFCWKWYNSVTSSMGQSLNDAGDMGFIVE